MKKQIGGGFIENKKYIILEIIPTKVSDGEIVQLSALKLNGLLLESRFDYRLDESKINNIDLLNMIQYDKEMFIYVDTSREIIMRFKEWIGDYDLLIIDNLYTENYLKNIKNKKESIFKYLNMVYSEDIIEKIIDKYNLEPSDHIVDLLYEALIIESNKNRSKEN